MLVKWCDLRCNVGQNAIPARTRPTMDDITRILQAAEKGDQETAARLLPAAYEELKRIARAKMAGERADHTLQPTALVHEAYLRLVGPGGEEPAWNNRNHFFAAAAEAMRRILVENARRKRSRKRGSNPHRTTLDENAMAGVIDSPSDQILAVDEALQKLEQEDPELAKVVLLRYFSGLTVPETAAALGVSPRTVDRSWRCARAWLYREIGDSGSGSP